VLLGFMRAMRALKLSGRITELPRIFAVQAANCAPLATAWNRDERVPAKIEQKPTFAANIAVPEPVRGAEVLHAVDESGGEVFTVTEDEIVEAQRNLAHRGWLVDASTAAGWAIVRRTGGGSMLGRTVLPLTAP
jgi:threonine synthase